MTTQTILSDAELIVKGYNAVIADTQYEFEDVKAEVLLQLEDLDEDFDTYREFELRLEAYENGAFDPDIEKILGIGGRKAGTWNPRSETAKLNRAKGRKEKHGSVGVEDTARIADAEAATRYRQAGKIHPSQFKGARPGGKLKGAGGRYKGGENISDRDSFAGAIARTVVDKKRKGKETVVGAGKKVGEKVSAGVEAAKAGAEETGRRGKQVTKITTTAAKDVKDVALTGKVQPTKVGGPRSSRPYVSPIQPKSTPAGTDKAPSAPQQGPYSSTGKYIGNVNKSFAARLRKSMGYRPRHRY